MNFSKLHSLFIYPIRPILPVNNNKPDLSRIMKNKMNETSICLSVPYQMIPRDRSHDQSRWWLMLNYPGPDINN